MSIASEITRIKTAIADAYDSCEAKGATMPTVENVANLADTIDTITGGGGEAVIRPLTIDEPYTPVSASSGVDGFSPVEARTRFMYLQPNHTDRYGVWHKPDDWDDIESMTFGEHDSVLYYLIDPHAYKDAFFRFRIYGTSCKWSVGRVSNGVFTAAPDGAETSISSGGYLEWTNLDEREEDYLVVRITGNPITYVTINAKSTDPKISAVSTPILMRYGNLPRGTSNSTIANAYIESDNLVHYRNESSATTQSFASYYANCYALQRLRLGGWDVVDKVTITSMASFLANCYWLSDLDMRDFSDWVTSSCTSIASAFSYLYNLSGRINVSNWDVSNVTTMSSVFSYSRSLDYIDGLDTWTNAPKCTRWDSMFSYCENLKNELDVGWGLGNGTAIFNNSGSVFQYCYSVPKITVRNVNLSDVPSVSSMFAHCRGVKEIVFDNVTPISDTCTSAASLFTNCWCLEELPNMDGWDFSNANVLTMFYYCFHLKRIDSSTWTPSTITMSDGSSTVIYGTYNQRLEYVDLTGLFESWTQFSSTYAHSNVIPSNCRFIKTFIIPSGLCKATTANAETLPHDVLMSVINALKDNVSGLALTLGSINLTKLSDAEKAIATGKGWTLK